MSLSLAPVDVPARSGRRGSRWPRLRLLLLAPLLVPVLAIGIVLQTDRASYAFSTTTPIEVGKTFLKSPGGKLLVTAGTMTPWGRAAKVALMAYATKDVWWPVLKGVLGNGDKTDTNGGNPGLCQLSMAALDRDPVDLRTVTFSVYKSDGCSFSNSAQTNVNFTGRCMVTTSGVVAPFTLTIFGVSVPAGSNSGSGPMNVNQFCGTGAQLLDITAVPSRSGSIARTVTWPYPDQFVKQETTVQCRKPDGTLVTITDSTVGQVDRVTVPSCADRVPGSIPWTGTIKAGPDGGTQKEIMSWSTKQDVFDEWADCFGSSGLQCTIRVWVDGVPCTIDRAVCQPWRKLADDPDTASRVQCKFGGHVIDTDDCIGISYKPDTPTKVIDKVNPDGSVDVDPEAPPKPTPTATPTPVQPIPTTGTNPQPRPTDPTTDPEGTPGGTGSCLAAAWSWNPIDWVYVPVKCVLVWSFKPPAGYLDAKLGTLKTALNGTTPGQWVTSVTTLTTPNQSGCDGIPVDVELGEGVAIHERLGYACSGALAGIAPVVKTALSAIVVVCGAWACVRAVGSGLGWSPSIGRGGESV